ncbi:MAG: carboxypeptidase-like regulatory domain-containing protein [Acidobacteriota bacterium]
MPSVIPSLKTLPLLLAMWSTSHAQEPAPKARLEGRVVNASGEAIPGVKLRLTAPSANGRVDKQALETARALKNFETSVTSDATGQFVFDNLAASEYYRLSAERSGYTNAYYGTRDNMIPGTTLTLKAGQILKGIVFTMTREAVISGKVTDAAGAPVKNAEVSLLQSTYNRGDGTFEIRNLVPGTYRLENRGNWVINGIPSPKLVGSMEITITDKDMDGIVMSLSPGAPVNGLIVLEGGDIKTVLTSTAPLDPTPYTFWQSGPPVRPLLRRPAAIGLAPTVGWVTPPMETVRDDGTFSLEYLTAGKYQLNLLPLPQGFYVKAITAGNTDLLHNVLNLTSAGSSPIRIVLSDKVATVTGQVTNDNGEPQVNARVTLWTSEPELGLTNNGILVAFTDQNGNFRFPGLAPGEYSAAAWVDVDSSLAQMRSFLDQFASSKRINLAEGTSTALDLKPIPIDNVKVAEARLP